MRTPFLVVLALAVPRLAAAEPSEPVGSVDRWLITTDAHVDFERTSFDDGTMHVVHDSFDGQLALDKVVIPHLSVGGGLGFDSDLTEGDGHREFHMFARAGTFLPLGRPDVVVWPRLGFAYAGTTYSQGNAYGTISAVRLDLSAPIVWQVMPHLLIGGGPALDVDLGAHWQDGSGAPTDTTFGVRGLLGGTF